MNFKIVYFKRFKLHGNETFKTTIFFKICRNFNTQPIPQKQTAKKVAIKRAAIMKVDKDRIEQDKGLPILDRNT